MSEAVAPSTFVRSLGYGTLHQLADFLDPQDSWKRVLMEIRKPTGEPRYSQLHLRRFEGVVAMGKSPTIALLSDWGTTNCTVGQLVDILVRNQLLAPARLLLPVPCPPSVHPSISETVGLSKQVTVAMGRAEERQLADSTRTQVEDKESPDDRGFHRFSFQELLQMTSNFDDRSASEGGGKLGEGGFGTVYRGNFNKVDVAVKKLNSMDDISPQDLKTQFNQEVQTLRTLKHKNLVEMVGFSCDGDHLCLVYPYMCNGSLLDRLACLGDSLPLSWTRRCLIAAGTARGLEYLHSNHHIHRDVKSANILLDETFEPKISDFGLTRASEKKSASTVLTEKIVGTTAYMAPEALRGEITPKSDVFSFGVVLLEVLSGLPPVDSSRDPQFLMEMKEEIEDEELTLEHFVDKKMGDWGQASVEKMYSVAKDCLSERKNRRPQMEEVLRELENILTTISLDQLSYEKKV
uniref:Interleukin-1 receptor-associated kinase 4 n=1 Tax=Scleropages formosus TaxID=113540 RepID=A0A8C9R7U3_SCLFO